MKYLDFLSRVQIGSCRFERERNGNSVHLLKRANTGDSFPLRFRDRLILSIDNNASREDRIITALETVSFTMIGAELARPDRHSIHVDPIEK